MSLRWQGSMFFCMLLFLGHPKKVKLRPTSKTEEDEEIPAEKQEDVDQELKPPSHSGHEEDQQLTKESVTALENVMTLFSAKVR